MLGVVGNYFLRLYFGKNTIPLDPSMIKEITIVQDINKFVPEFRMRISDTQGYFTHIVPFDHGLSKVTLMLSQDINSDNPVQAYLFDVYMRTPVSEGVALGEYDIVGLLSVEGLFSPSISRSFNQPVSDTITALATEMGILSNLSSSLTSTKTLIQANWSNAQFLQYLKDNLEGDNFVSNFKSFIVVGTPGATGNGLLPVLNFKSYDELLTAQIKYRFAFVDGGYQGVDSTRDYIPAYKYEIIDNYKYLQMLGTRSQQFMYFSYETGKWVVDQFTLDQMLGLAEYHLVDQNDQDVSQQYTDTGRSNPFTGSFFGKINSVYETRIGDLTKIWISTDGNFNIRPGDLIQLDFLQATSTITEYQYAGYWLVERVVLSIDDTLRMQLFLTRNGVNTSTGTTLIPATEVRI